MSLEARALIPFSEHSLAQSLFRQALTLQLEDFSQAGMQKG